MNYFDQLETKSERFIFLNVQVNGDPVCLNFVNILSELSQESHRQKCPFIVLYSSLYLD